MLILQMNIFPLLTICQLPPFSNAKQFLIETKEKSSGNVKKHMTEVNDILILNSDLSSPASLTVRILFLRYEIKKGLRAAGVKKCP